MLRRIGLDRDDLGGALVGGQQRTARQLPQRDRTRVRLGQMLGRAPGEKRLRTPRLPDPADLLRRADGLRARWPSSWQQRGRADRGRRRAKPRSTAAKSSNSSRSATRPAEQIPRASSPSGYAFDIEVDTHGVTDPSAPRSGSQPTASPRPVRKAVVTLPEGVTINPSVGAGLGVCTPAQYESARRQARRSAPVARASRRSATSASAARSSPGRSRARSSSPRPTTTPSAACSPSTWSPSRSSAASWSRSPESSKPTRAPAASPRPSTSCRSCPTRDLSIHFREGQRSPLATPPACGTISTEADSHAVARPERGQARIAARRDHARESGAVPAPRAWRPSRRRQKAACSTPAPAPTRPSTCT